MKSLKQNLAEDYRVRVQVPKEIEVTEQAAMRVQECEDALNAVPNIEERMRLHKTLQDSLDTIVRLGPPRKLMMDFAPLSFTFSGGGLFGGLIFHGSGREFCVHMVENYHGWSLHT